MLLKGRVIGISMRSAEKCREVKRGVEKCEQCPGGREVGEPLASVMEVATNILPKMFECSI